MNKKTIISFLPARCHFYRAKVSTYIWIQKGWLYLAVVIDLFSGKMVGWRSMSSRMKASLVCGALRMAIWLRRPSLGLIVQQYSWVAVCWQSIS